MEDHGKSLHLDKYMFFEGCENGVLYKIRVHKQRSGVLGAGGWLLGGVGFEGGREA